MAGSGHGGDGNAGSTSQGGGGQAGAGGDAGCHLLKAGETGDHGLTVVYPAENSGDALQGTNTSEWMRVANNALFLMGGIGSNVYRATL